MKVVSSEWSVVSDPKAEKGRETSNVRRETERLHAIRFTLYEGKKV